MNSFQDKKVDRRRLITMASAIGSAFLLPTSGASAANKEFHGISTPPYDVKKFGATGRREQNATQFFQKAIDTCTAQGGGIVNVPAGDFTIGMIELKNNITLNLEGGATLFLSQEKKDFPKRKRAMIYAEHCKNIGITGGGLMNGLAQYEYLPMQGVDGEISNEIELARAAGLDMRRYYRSKTALNAYMMIIEDCSDVLLTGIKIINSPLWTVKLDHCQRVGVRGIQIFSDLQKGVNADGIDICSCKEVTVSDCLIETGDDSIVLKAIAGKRPKAQPCENIIVSNCLLSSSSTAVMIGTETEADIRHITVTNCVITNSNKGFGINVQDGAVVSDVVIGNLTIETNRRHWNWWGSAEMCKLVLKKRHENSKLGRIRNILIHDIVAHVRGTSVIAGHTEQSIEDLVISNVQLFMHPENAKDKRATHALSISNVLGMDIRNSSIHWDENAELKWESAIVASDINDFTIDGIKARQGRIGADFPAILIRHSTDGVIRNCKAMQSTGTFIHVEGNAKTDLLIQYCDTRKAKADFTFSSEEVEKSVHIFR